MNVNEKDYYEVFKRDDGFCRYCGNDMLRDFSTFASATMDHVLARSRGGGDEPSNLVLACPGCNQHLSHQGSLTSFEERKEYLEQIQRERMHKLEALRNELRKKTTDIGYVNRNDQTVVRATGLPGNDHLQNIYVLRCGSCTSQYGANGSDIFQRKCPSCQGGAPGLSYDESP